MSTTLTPSLHEPKVFIAMPYDRKFDNIFNALQKVVRKVGACPIRQDRDGDMGNVLEQTHQYLREVNVVLAVITDCNANVLNEVGYAQAFNKIILPILQWPPEKTSRNEKWRYEIPYNISHIHVHRYGEDRAELESKLVKLLSRAIEQSMKPPFVINIGGEDIPACDDLSESWPLVEAWGGPYESEVRFAAYLRNDSNRMLPPNFYAYLYAKPGCRLVPRSFIGSYGFFKADVLASVPVNDKDLLGLTCQYRLNIALPAIPPKASEDFTIVIECDPNEPEIVEYFLIRICTDTLTFNFPYALRVRR